MRLALTTMLTAWMVGMLGVPRFARADDPVPLVPPDPAQWLVDHALAYGERVTEPQPDDAEYVLVWMDAAARVSPDLADAHLWRYDLLNRIDRPADAHTALAEYCRCAPHDLSAAFNLLDLEFAAAQTAESRIDLCRQRLQRPDLARELASDLHRRLAEIHYAQGNTADALRAAQQAVNLVPLNLPAQQLLAVVENRPEEPASRIRLLLTELAVQPSSIDVRWRLADTLAALGMPEDALAWYAHTEAAFIRQFPESPLRPDLLLATAGARDDSGDHDGAIDDCRRVLSADPADLAAAQKLITVARNAGLDEIAKSQTSRLAATLRELEPQAVTTRNAAVCYRIAVFHLDVDYDVHRALEFARSADEFQPNNPAVRTALGRALLEIGQLDDAISVLTPVAVADPDAALALARALRSLDRRAEATAVLQDAARRRFAGEAYRKIKAVLRELHADLPPPPDRNAIRSALVEFDNTVLDFDLNPATAIDFDVKLRHAELPMTAPIRADVTLENIGSHAVTIGDERMIPPQVAVSLQVDGDEESQRTGYLTIDLNRRYTLFPGERTTATARLNTTAIQPLLLHQPQRRRKLAFTFTLAPVLTPEDAIVAHFAGIPSVTRSVTRRPVDASPAALERLAAQLRTGSEPERLAAVDIIEALIIERREAIKDVLHDYAAATIDDAQLARLLHVGFHDTSPIVRAKSVHAFNDLPLAEETIDEIAPLLADEHFLPRLLACDLFAKRQRKVFLPVLERLAEDADPLIARLAALHRARIQPQP